MDESTKLVINRVKEVLEEVGTCISQARVSLSEAKDELSDLFETLGRMDAVNSHHRAVTEAKALSEVREIVRSANSGG